MFNFKRITDHKQINEKNGHRVPANFDNILFCFDASLINPDNVAVGMAYG